jgi:mono/diheme cytochrome c family protein
MICHLVIRALVIDSSFGFRHSDFILESHRNFPYLTPRADSRNSEGALSMRLQSMRRTCAIPLIAILIVTLTLACQSKEEKQRAAAREAMTQMQIFTPTERGKYLVTVAACSECHTPFKMGANGPEPDMTRYLSGHPQDLKLPPPPKLPEGPWVMVGAGTNTAFAGPWGITFAANLTPDNHTGMGIWTEDMFLKAMKTGKHMSGGRQILPPMPQPAYAHMTDADLKAIYAYLRSIPKISNRVPDYVPPEKPTTQPAQ